MSGLGEMGNLMKQAQEMQAKMGELQEQMSRTEMTGSSGGGLVQVTMNGKGELRAVRIDPSLVEPGGVEVLEDLVVALSACPQDLSPCNAFNPGPMAMRIWETS